MAKDKKTATIDIRLSDQQFRILDILNELGEGTVREVQAMLPSDLAHTTVGTMLTRLEKKGVLASEPRGRERVFRPLLSTADVQRSTVSGLISTMFGGSSSALLAHLLREEEIADGDLAEIKKMLDEES